MGFYTVLGVMFYGHNTLLPLTRLVESNGMEMSKKKKKILQIAWRILGEAKIHDHQLVVGKLVGACQYI